MEDKTLFKLHYSAEVQNAIENNIPIVALESTIITHGMKYPVNYETAKAVEDVIRKEGAVPATIAIIDGKVHVGLSEEQIHSVSKADNFKKCTTRDIPYVVMKKMNGSLTVAATMHIAKMANIKVFVTGGIGGVHKGVSESWDISADLLELSRTNVSVVCAGIKSILDIPKTLEYLETSSVPVIGLKTSKFPEFFFSEGDCDVPMRLESEEECANFIYHNNDIFNMKSGILFAVSVPKEAQADKTLVTNSINNALKKAQANNIKGQDVTPFLLKEVNEISGGESCRSNVALIKNNALVGARICVAYNNLQKKRK